MKWSGLALLLALSVPSFACTIFVMTDRQHTLFCNNEDWQDPKTFVWFVPAKGPRLGCAYVGFGNQWAQGGVNSAGLAYDWVAGFDEKWVRDPKLKKPRGNSAERMLESCRTVDEAIAFYQDYWEPDFGRSWILIADRSGASAIVGAKAGKLTVNRETNCRGFGAGRSTLQKTLPQQPEPNVVAAFEILKQARTSGRYATKYSTVYDLTSGEIYLHPATDDGEPIKIKLDEELDKGRHIYAIPILREQLKQPLQKTSLYKEVAKTVSCWFRN